MKERIFAEPEVEIVREWVVDRVRVDLIHEGETLRVWITPRAEKMLDCLSDEDYAQFLFSCSIASSIGSSCVKVMLLQGSITMQFIRA